MGGQRRSLLLGVQRTFHDAECMTNIPNASYEDIARKVITEDSRYVSAMTAMGERKQITVREDIYTRDGRVLVAKGSVVTGDLREWLLNHKLLRPIDCSLDVADAVSADSLARDAARLIDENAFLGQLAYRSGDPLAMRHGMARLALPRSLAFKLTVAQEQRPELFRHLLMVALISHYLAIRVGLDTQDTTRLLASALLHDLGELHTDPAILDPRHRVGEHEWRQICVHPITGYLIAREAGGLGESALAGILQHHERIDGSGYPYGLRDERVCRFARIIGLADSGAAILTRFGSVARLDAVVRLNQGRYDRQLLSFLQDGLRRSIEVPAPSHAPIRRVTRAQLDTALYLLEDWGDLRAALCGPDGTSPPPELAFLFERMLSVHSSLLQFGFDPDSIEGLLELAAEDSLIAAELSTALDEMNWQFRDLAREIAFRWDLMMRGVSAAQGERLARWRSHLAELGELPVPGHS